MNQTGIDRFREGAQVLLLSQPFFGSLLMKLRHSPEQCGTLYTDSVRLAYDPDFMAKQSVEQAVFCVAHEVLHCAWQHIPRLKHYLDTGIGPDGKPLDTARFNRALDYPLNASLVATGVGAVPAGINICLDRQRFPETMTPEEVYCLLAEEEQGGGGGGGGGGGAGKHAGQEALDGHGVPDNMVDAITPADVMQAVTTCKAMRGTLPAGMERFIDEIKRPDVSPWKRLRQSIVTSMPGDASSTWRRLQRRMIVRNIGMPGRVQVGSGVIGVVVDTSGSIDKEMLQLFGGHMASIMHDARPREVRVYWTDAEVHRVDTVKTPVDLQRLLSKPVPGGGGTDMREGVVAAGDDGCHSIVVLTDGYTPFCEGKVKTIWAITSSKKSPHGETIHIG